MHYHLIGICGTAMASLAGMLQVRGHRVTGSDENVYPPMSNILEGLGIRLMQGYDAAHLTPAPDCVVVGNAIPRGNPEVEETLNRKLLYRSLPEVIKEEFIRGRRSRVVAGTHGKTTTTSLAAGVIDQAGLIPSFLVGGVVKLAFRRLMNLVPGNGKLIAGWDSQPVRDVVASFGTKLFSQLETFGTAG